MFDDFWSQWLGKAILWILNALSSILNALNPMNYILKFAEMVIGILPNPADLSEFYSGFETSMQWLAPSLQLINHFVNLQMFGLAIALVIVIETTINIFRAWRAIRSFVT